MSEQTQTAPAPHFPHTEFLPGPKITAACPCGWRRIASSHEHSTALGDEHRAETGSPSREEEQRAARQRAADHAGRQGRIDDLSRSIRRIHETGGYWNGAA